MKEVTVEVECPECEGTGIYSGMYEPQHTGVICRNCGGIGSKSLTYKRFVARNQSRNNYVVVPNLHSFIGKRVKTYRRDPDTDSFSQEERTTQRWGVHGTVYDERMKQGDIHYLVGHADGPPVWYGRFEIKFLE